MVGFPSETDEDFTDTYELMKQARFHGAFTFIYSPRAGTKAADMPEQVPEKISKQRIAKLIELQSSINKEISEGYLNRLAEVLAEGYDKKKDMYFGRDEFGKMIYFTSANNAVGEFVQVRITKANGISLTGKTEN